MWNGHQNSRAAAVAAAAAGENADVDVVLRVLQQQFLIYVGKAKHWAWTVSREKNGQSGTSLSLWAIWPQFKASYWPAEGSLGSKSTENKLPLLLSSIASFWIRDLSHARAGCAVRCKMAALARDGANSKTKLKRIASKKHLLMLIIAAKAKLTFASCVACFFNICFVMDR